MSGHYIYQRHQRHVCEMEAAVSRSPVVGTLWCCGECHSYWLYECRRSTPFKEYDWVLVSPRRAEKLLRHRARSSS